MSSWSDFWNDLKLETVKRCNDNKDFEEVLLGMIDIVQLKEKEYFKSQVVLVEKQIQDKKEWLKCESATSDDYEDLWELRGVLKVYKELAEGL